MFEGLFQPMHLLVILGIALLIFGPKKLPELGKGLGDGIKGFKEAISGKDAPPQAATPAPAPPATTAAAPQVTPSANSPIAKPDSSETTVHSA